MTSGLAHWAATKLATHGKRLGDGGDGRPLPPLDLPGHYSSGSRHFCYRTGPQRGMEMKSDITQRTELPLTAREPDASAPECAGCQKPIRERYLLKALDQFWHEDCLKCACCDCRLGEVGSTLFTKANLILCKRDYLRLFGTTGLCSACNKTIPAFEMVMRARGNVYHLECFACQQCNHRFCVGDRFYLFDNKILCEYDYEERILFSGIPPYGLNSLEQLKRQTERLTPSSQDDATSGYGSPDSLLSDGK